MYLDAIIAYSLNCFSKKKKPKKLYLVPIWSRGREDREPGSYNVQRGRQQGEQKCWGWETREGSE